MEQEENVLSKYASDVDNNNLLKQVNKMGKLVSVIIPSCNDGKYLEKAINSMLAQTYSDIEIIVVDSSDDSITLNVLEKYEKQIKCFHEPRRGIAAALNLGLSKASGDYVARMDADDISLPQRIFMQIDFLEKNRDIDVLGTQGDIIDQDGVIIGYIEPGYYIDSEIKSNLIFENCMVHPSIMMRGELIKEGWRYDENCYVEDLRLWMQMAAKGVKFANLREHLVLYRQCGKNMSSDSSKVAPATAMSAKEYAETMFDLEVDKYEAEDFTRPYYSNIIRKSKAEYIVTQLELLRNIYLNNEKNGIVDSGKLVKELNKRWKWVYSRYGQIVTQLCRKDVFCPEVGETVFFYHEITKKLHLLEDDASLITIFRDILTINEKFVLKQCKEKKTLVIYGMGKKGTELLSEYERKYNSGELKWKLVAVSDAKAMQISCCNKKMFTINQEQLVKLNPDIVVISTNKFYEEIYSELVEKGLKSRIMDSCWIL